MTLVEEWLESKGVTLWADWNISDPVRRQVAADWFSQQMAQYLAFCAKRAKDNQPAVGTIREWDVV